MTQKDRPLSSVESRTDTNKCLLGDGAVRQTPFDRLDQNTRETANTLTDNFAAGLTGQQQQLFKDAVVDALGKHVGSLAKLASPENTVVAGQFMNMMDKVGDFDVTLQRGKENSISFFDKHSNEGIRLTVGPGGGDGSSPSPRIELVKRDINGMVVPSLSQDCFGIAKKQEQLADHIARIIDRD